ncbi:hypothetical protein CIG11343_0491 [Campylobacter iguaniorum]|uniref:hypothetical protein n=1 Tax=Campylobacter iguaniorum TaxID=1244531 RepID=UPI0007C8E166|nr:hypothetical protein [Campylobacter iguaniorum]ANE35570.1 hypothetical protein CIG11343_0491 [Campylobacter iguaniorum]
MKKVVFLFGIAILVGIILAFEFGKGNDIKYASGESNVTCDLNLDNCSVQVSGEPVTFAFSPKPLVAMVPTSLKIYGLKGEFKELKARIYGLNIDMGVIEVDLEKRSDIYMSNVVLSSCVVSLMQWRLELFEGKKPLGIHIDFNLKS